ncbi:MAG: GNAT family N-acetyltransferase [Alphaproteobacteria bacterium]
MLRDSIERLCTGDHRDDAEVLAGWLSNKTPERFRDWLADPAGIVVVAERDDGRIAGVGACSGTGEITLNYVAPDARFQGVSTALLGWLEAHLRARGVATATLTSTNTAEAFYRARGYRDAGPRVAWRKDTRVQPMTKPL